MNRVSLPFLLLLLLMASSSGSQDKPAAGLKPAQLPTTDTVVVARMSPDGSTVTLLTEKFAKSADGAEARSWLELQLWSVDEKRIVLKRAIDERVKRPAETGEWSPGWQPRGVHMVYSGDGRQLLVSCRGWLHLLDATTLEGRRIELRVPETKDSVITGLASAREEPYLAVAIAEKGAGIVVVYDVLTGEQAARWQFRWEIGEMSWEPKGSRLAVTLLTEIPGVPRPLAVFRSHDANLFILDARTGQILRQIHAGYAIRPVCFGPDNRVLTASQAIDPDNTIRFWDVGTGRLAREISKKPEGVHQILQLSADGRRILAYTGRDKAKSKFFDETYVVNEYVQFTVWDYNTGRVIVSSGRIPVPNLNAYPNFLMLGISAKGNRVLLSWGLGQWPVFVFDFE